MGREALTQDRLGKVGGKEVAAGGQVDEMLDGGAALDAGEEVHGREEFVGAGQVEEDGVDAVAGELGFEPLGVLDGSFDYGGLVVVRWGDRGFETGGVAGGEDECFDGVGLNQERNELGSNVAGSGSDEDVRHDYVLTLQYWRWYEWRMNMKGILQRAFCFKQTK